MRLSQVEIAMTNGSGSDVGTTPVASGGTVAGGYGRHVVAQRFARNRLALAGLIVFGLLVLVAVLGPLLVGGAADDNPAIHTRILAALQGPSVAYPLGTGAVGDDELARGVLVTRLWGRRGR